MLLVLLFCPGQPKLAAGEQYSNLGKLLLSLQDVNDAVVVAARLQASAMLGREAAETPAQQC